MLHSELNEAARILSNDTIFLKNAAELYTLKLLQRRGTYRELVNRYYRQIRYGCQNSMCETPTCLSCQKRKAKGPFRRLTILSARTLASLLAYQDDPEQKLCHYPPVSLDIVVPPHVVENLPKDNVVYASELLDGQDEIDSPHLFLGLQQKPRKQKGKQVHKHETILESESTIQPNQIELDTNKSKNSKDPKSLSQNLYDTKSWRFLQNLKFEKGMFSWVPVTRSDNDFSVDLKRARIDSVGEPKPGPNMTTLTPVKEPMASDAVGNLSWQSRSSSLDKFLTLSRFTPDNVNALWNLTSATRKSSDSEMALIKSLGLTVPYSRIPLPSGVSPTSSDIFTSCSFALQSIVYVLSTSKALLQSFKRHGLDQIEGEINAIHHADIIVAFRQLGDIEIHPRRVFPSLWASLGDAFAIHRHSRSSSYRILSSLRTSDSFSTPLRSMDQSPQIDNAEMMSDQDAAHVMKIVLAALAASVPRVNNSTWEDVVRHRSSGHITPYDPLHGVYAIRAFQMVMDSYEDELAINLMIRLIRVFSSHRCYSQLSETRDDVHVEDSIGREQGSKFSKELVSFMNDHGKILTLTPDIIAFEKLMARTTENSESKYPFYRRQSFSTIVLEWVRTVILKEWDGKPEVQRWNVVGGGLDLMACLYQNREELHLLERDFYTPFFSARLNAAEMPVDWISLTLRRETVHLLSYPFLFSPSTLVMYFRAINYAAMFKAFETSYTMTRMLFQMSQVSSRNSDHLCNRLRTAMTNNLVLEIRRDNILTDALNQLWRREKRELLRPLKVRMGMDEGEEGVDLGGVQQEFFRIAIGEALNPDYGLFTTHLTNRMSWFQPCSLEPLYKFELLGLLVSLAIYNGLTLPVTFPLALYRKVLDLPVDNLDHIRDGWPELTKGLRELLDWPGGDVEDVFIRSYVFSVEAWGTTLNVNMEQFGREDIWPRATNDRLQERLGTSSLDLQPDQEAPIQSTNSSIASLEPASESSDGWSALSLQPANTETGNTQGPGQASDSQSSQWTSYSSEPSMVNNANRKDYVDDYVYWLLDKSIRPQYEAFARGFFMCIDRKAVSMFSPEALQTVVEGIQEIDIGQLAQVAKYDGYAADHRVIKDFWSVVYSFTHDQVRRLLEFVTASDRIPVNGVRSIAFVIQKNGTGDERLPTSTTCFGRLLLPEYSSKERLKERLCLAMENCHGFGNG